MRVEIRETGSIRVSAGKDRVLEILQRHFADAAVQGDRVESSKGAFVVRESENGTRVFHVRKETAPVTHATRDRETLRQAVQADLFELDRVLQLSQR